MPPFPSLSANSSPMSRATKTGVPTQTIATIVFGICAVMGTIFTIWQGHKSLKMRNQRKRESKAVSSEIELQSTNELGPQRPRPRVFPHLPDAPKKTLPCSPEAPEKTLPRLPKVPKKTFDITITSIPPKEVFESRGPRSTPIPMPPGAKTKSHQRPDTRRASPHRGRINRALT